MILLLPLLLNCANAEWFAPVRTKVTLTADELIKSGYVVKTDGEVLSAQNKALGFEIKAERTFVTRSFSIDGGRQNYEDLEVTPETKKLVSETLCSAAPENSTDKRMRCRTVTAEYCASLTKLSDNEMFGSQVRKIEECGKILEKIDFNSDNIKLRHQDAMARIKKLNNPPKGEVVSEVGAPRSLLTIAQDWHACKSFEGAWAEPGIKKGDRADSRVTR